MPFCDLILFHSLILADNQYILFLCCLELTLELIIVGDSMCYIRSQTSWKMNAGTPRLFTKYIGLVTHLEKIVYVIDSLLS